MLTLSDDKHPTIPLRKSTRLLKFELKYNPSTLHQGRGESLIFSLLPDIKVNFVIWQRDCKMPGDHDSNSIIYIIILHA